MSIDQFRTVERDGVEFPVDKVGFPVEACSRCQGSGHHSYCQRFGTTCFKCQGSGAVHAAGKAGKLAAEYHDTVREQSSATASTIVAGDEIRQHMGEQYRTVATVETTDVECGRSRIGNDPWVIHYSVDVTFTDGTSARIGSATWSRKVAVDRAPYVESAQQAQTAKLRRRLARAAI